MPELPEVETTAKILNSLVSGLVISDVWTNYRSAFYVGKENIKDENYFKKFKKEIIGEKIEKVHRRAKNVLISLSNGKTILIHMKMTGHLLYGNYKFNKKENEWKPADTKSSLADPFNRFIRLVFTFSNGKHLAFSDMRKFATITLLPDHKSFITNFENIGPEPLEKSFDWKILKERLSIKPNGKIKTVLMDQTIIAGIGNIYSDEILWSSSIHPERKISSLKDSEIKEVFKNTKEILKKGINFGGDSMSDYRNPYGHRGDFQNHHNAYRKTGDNCNRHGCKGIIKKIKVGGRSTHFCPKHQKLYN